MKKLIFIAIALLCLQCIYSQMPTLPQGGVMPDNIIEADCFTTPPKREWAIKRLPDVNENIFSAESVSLVGDVDDDGKPEIVLLGYTPSSSNNPYYLYILNGETQAVKKKFPIDYSYSGICPLAGIAKIKWTDGSLKTIIVTYTSISLNLFAYDINGNKLWTSVEDAKEAPRNGATIQILDVDGDGLSEIIIGGKVFAAETGRLITQISNNYQGYIHSWGNNYSYMQQSMVGNLKNDGAMRLCIGNTIWKFNTKLTNRNGLNSGALTLETTFPNQVYVGSTAQTVPTGGDGCVQLADIDLDGNLDIIVSTVQRDESTPRNSVFYVYVYSWAKNKIITSKKVPNVYKRSIPFIGDIDGDKYPEIIFTHGAEVGNNLNTTYDFITALKYNPSSQELTYFWRTSHDDSSGATGMTLFDFNQDGVSEIVYRDNTKLRIMDGSKSSGVTNLATFDCTSSTAFEYPVVADVDGDGQAEIIVTGGIKGMVHTSVGQLFVLKAGAETTGNPTFWAAARPVWNTLSYNPLHVNKDLTIPKVLLSQATIFAGNNAVLGNDDDVEPFNNFLQQATTLNKYGMPFWLAGDAQFASYPEYIYDKGKDELRITLKIINNGAVRFENPFYITIYKDKISASSQKVTTTYAGTIDPNEMITIHCKLTNFKTSWNPNNGIIVKLNDKGLSNGEAHQLVCNAASPIYYYPVIPTNQDDCSDVVDRNMTCPYAAVGSTFQWQLSKDRGITWSDIKGATNREYTTNQTGGTVLYRVKVKLPNSVETTSEAVTFRMRSCQMPVNHNISVMGYQ